VHDPHADSPAIHPEAPSQTEAIRQILTKKLGIDPGVTVIPNIVSGRDIV
jgi:hypothetical protein